MASAVALGGVGALSAAIMPGLPNRPHVATPSPAIHVVAGIVASHDVPIYLRGVGTVIAYNTTVVRSQIQGQLIDVPFVEGRTVKIGDRVQMTFRRLFTADGVHNYFWKARPLIEQGEQKEAS